MACTQPAPAAHMQQASSAWPAHAHPAAAKKSQHTSTAAHLRIASAGHQPYQMHIAYLWSARSDAQSSSTKQPCQLCAPADTVVPSARRHSTYGSKGTELTGVSLCSRALSTWMGPDMPPPPPATLLLLPPRAVQVGWAAAGGAERIPRLAAARLSTRTCERMRAHGALTKA